MKTLREMLQEHSDRKRDEADTALAEIVWRQPASDEQMGDAYVIRNKVVELGKAVDLPGKLFQDGHRRIVVHPDQHLRGVTRG